MTRWRATGVDLATGDDVELVGTSDGPVHQLPGRYLLPGLVDAHAHLSIDVRAPMGDGHGRPELIAAQLAQQLAAGVLVVRDVGAVPGVWVGGAHGDRGPLVLAAGRFLAPSGRYFPGFYEGVDPDELLDAAVAELARGGGWLKVIADFPSTLPPIADHVLSPPATFDLERVAAMVELAHAKGARVAAHAMGPVVADLVDAGVDSIEHGTSMTADALTALGRRGGAWTPTVSATCLGLGHEHPHLGLLGELVEAAEQLGVTVLAGTDTIPHGSLAREVAGLAAMGLGSERALAAASWRARAWLGVPAWLPGAPLDVVTYDADPRDDLAVLEHPVAIVIADHRVH